MNFLLVLGVQKGGTTWLHQQLEHHPQYESAYIKEWQCIIKATKESMKDGDKNYSLLNINKGEWMQKKDQQKRIFASKNLCNYLSIQKSASQWDPSCTQCVGDATPGNGIADEKTLTFFKESAESAGFTLKPILLMRDPTLRHLSATIMNYSIKVLKDIKCSGITSFDPEIHSKTLNSHAIKKVKRWQIRGQYEKQIPIFDNVFGKNEVKYIFSENLRKDHAIDVITEYLELNQFGTANMPNYPQAKGANATIKHQFSSKTQSMVRSEFSETYKFIIQRFGKEVPNAWLI